MKQSALNQSYHQAVLLIVCSFSVTNEINFLQLFMRICCEISMMSRQRVHLVSKCSWVLYTYKASRGQGMLVKSSQWITKSFTVVSSWYLRLFHVAILYCDFVNMIMCDLMTWHYVFEVIRPTITRPYKTAWIGKGTFSSSVYYFQHSILKSSLLVLIIPINKVSLIVQ